MLATSAQTITEPGTTSEQLASAAPGMRVVQDVEIEEFRQGGRVYDRRVTVVFECGHRKQLALPIDALVNVVAGGLSRCLSCSCGVRS